MASSPERPPPERRQTFLDLIRQGAPPPPRVPYKELLLRVAAEAEEARAGPAWRATVGAARDDPDRPLVEPIAALLTHTLASGRDMISGREIFWRLRVPPNREACEKRAIARTIRALGWVRVRYGPQDKRIWGWRWREWNVSHVKIDLKS